MHYIIYGTICQLILHQFFTTVNCLYAHHYVNSSLQRRNQLASVDADAAIETCAFLVAAVKRAQHNTSAHLRMPLPLLLQAALLGYNQI